jgi:hypothetical protein
MAEIDLLADLDPACPRGCGRSMDDCYEVQDGGDCAGSGLVRRLEAELAQAQALAAGLRVQWAALYDDGDSWTAGEDRADAEQLVARSPVMPRPRLVQRLVGGWVPADACARCGGLDGTHTVRGCGGSGPAGGEADRGEAS